MAKCTRCGAKFRWNWVRHPLCLKCRKIMKEAGESITTWPVCRVDGKTRVDREGNVCRYHGGAMPQPHRPAEIQSKNTLVTVTFELTPNIDPQRFIEWLQVECSIAEDGNGSMHQEGRQVRLNPPVQITLMSLSDGKET